MESVKIQLDRIGFLMKNEPEKWEEWERDIYLEESGKKNTRALIDKEMMLMQEKNLQLKLQLKGTQKNNTISSNESSNSLYGPYVYLSPVFMRKMDSN